MEGGHSRVGEALTKSRNWRADSGGAIMELEMWRVVGRVIRAVSTLLRLGRTTIVENELLAIIWYIWVRKERESHAVS
jgi:hypothetical protein